MDKSIKYIQKNEEYQRFLQNIQQKQRLYIDLEFDKNHFRYGFHLCLVQLFDEKTCYLIDPLSKEINIEELFLVIESEEVELVCFSFDEDMRLFHHLGAVPRQIVDLGIAMKLLNWGTLSLNNSIKAILGEDYLESEENKQKSNWLKRPLTESQIQYAATDVLYLPDLYQELKSRLQGKGRYDWFLQEMKAFENKNWSDDEVSKIFTKKDRKELNLQEWVRFEKLMYFREECSEKLNRPSFKTWDKSIAKELAQQPKKIEQWNQWKGLHPRLRNDEVKSEVRALLQEAEQEIKEEELPAEKYVVNNHKTLSLQEKQQRKQKRKRQKEEKEGFYLPLKEKVQEQYGDEFGNYILSNRIVTEYLNKQRQPLPYQKTLFKQISNQLNLPIPVYLWE